MRHLLLLAFLIASSIAPYVLRVTVLQTHKSLSAHIATRKNTVWFARLTILLTAILVLGWYWGWYAEVYAVPLVQAALITLVCVLAICVGIVPLYEDKRSGRVHDLLAWAYAYVLPPTMLTFLLTSTQMLSQLIIVLSVSWQVFGVCMHITKSTLLRKSFLYFQLSYIGVFGLVLLAVTYIG